MEFGKKNVCFSDFRYYNRTSTNRTNVPNKFVHNRSCCKFSFTCNKCCIFQTESSHLHLFLKMNGVFDSFHTTSKEQFQFSCILQGRNLSPSLCQKHFDKLALTAFKKNFFYLIKQILGNFY